MTDVVAQINKRPLQEMLERARLLRSSLNVELAVMTFATLLQLVNLVLSLVCAALVNRIDIDLCVPSSIMASAGLITLVALFEDDSLPTGCRIMLCGGFFPEIMSAIFVQSPGLETVTLWTSALASVVGVAAFIVLAIRAASRLFAAIAEAKFASLGQAEQSDAARVHRTDATVTE